MGAWQFQGVLNVGIQIMLLVFAGWCFARFRLLSAEQFMGQINVLVLRVAFPTLTIYLLGLKVDLRDAEVWTSLGAYVLWIAIVQAGISLYSWLCNGSNIGDAAVLNLVLTANNTIIVGLPVMEATFPDVGSRLSLLSAFPLFMQAIPYSIAAFEVEKWMVEDHDAQQRAAATALSEPPSTPNRELSGRWVAQEDGCGGEGGGSDDNEKGDGDGGETRPSVAAPVAVCGPPRPSGGGGSGRLSRRREAPLGRSSGSSAGAEGGANGGGPSSKGLRKGRLGRRRVGGGMVVGAVAGGWAPATPQDSDASGAGNTCMADGVGTGIRGGLDEHPLLSRGSAAGPSVGADPRSEVSMSMGLAPAAPSPLPQSPPAVPSPLPQSLPAVPSARLALVLSREPVASASCSGAAQEVSPGDSAVRHGSCTLWTDRPGGLSGMLAQKQEEEEQASTPTAAAPAAASPPLAPWRDPLMGPPLSPSTGPLAATMVPTPGSVALACLETETPVSSPCPAAAGVLGGRLQLSTAVGVVPELAAAAAAAATAAGASAAPIFAGVPVEEGLLGYQRRHPAAAGLGSQHGEGSAGQQPLRSSNVVRCSSHGSSSGSGSTSGCFSGDGEADGAGGQQGLRPGCRRKTCGRTQTPPESAPPAISSGRNHVAVMAGAPQSGEGLVAAMSTATAGAGPASAPCLAEGSVQPPGRQHNNNHKIEPGAPVRASTGLASVSASPAGMNTSRMTLHRRLLKGRASADLSGRYRVDIAVSSGRGTAASGGAASARGTGSRRRPVGQEARHPAPAKQDIQRLSMPVHWPPLFEAALDDTDGRAGQVGRSGGRGGGGSAAPSPPASSGRLLSPLAVACPDLPVPQAISLARATTGLSNPGRGRQRNLAALSAPFTGTPTATATATTRRAAAPASRPPAFQRASAPLLAVEGDEPARSASHHSSAAAGGRRSKSGFSEEELDQQQLEVESVDMTNRDLVRAAAGSMIRRRGGLARAVWVWLRMKAEQYRRVWFITWVVIKNPLLWSLLVALLVNLSGLRQLLYPGSPHYRPELGWVAGALSWASSITVPVSLFSNGVWLYGKTFGRATLWRAVRLFALKVAVLGPLQLVCAAACRLQGTAAMSVLLLALCPVASTSFVIASQYGHGADIVTATTVLGIVLLVPVVLVALALPKAFGLYSYTVTAIS